MGRGVGLHHEAPGLWFYPERSGPPPSLGPVGGFWLSFAAVGVLVLAWLLLGWRVYRGGVRLRVLLGVTVLWSVPLLLAPPLFSPDAFTYTALGAALNRGVDLYQLGPGAAGPIAAVRGAEPAWLFTPTAYGPGFLVLVGAVSRLLAEDLVAVVLALRVLTIAAVAGCAALLVVLARWHGHDPRRAVWLGVANPLVLLHAVSANHNDVLVVLALLGGAALAVRGHPWLGIVACVAGAEIKIVALAGAAVIGADLALRHRGRLRQAGVLLAAGGFTVAVFAGGVWAAGLGWGFLGALSNPGIAHQPLAPVVAVADLIDPLTPPDGPVLTVAAVLAAGVIGWLLTRVPRWGVVRVLGWVLLVLVAASPVVWAWYLLWPILLLAAVPGRRGALVAVALSVGVLVTVLPGGEGVLVMLTRPHASYLVLGGLGTLIVLAAVVGRRPTHGGPRSTAEP